MTTGDRLAVGDVSIRFWGASLLHVLGGSYLGSASGSTPHNGGDSMSVSPPGSSGDLLVLVAHKRFTGAFASVPSDVTLRESTATGAGLFEIYTATHDGRASYDWTAPAGTVMAAVIVASVGSYDTHSTVNSGDGNPEATALGLTAGGDGMLIGMWGWTRQNALTPPAGMDEREHLLATHDTDGSRTGLLVATEGGLVFDPPDLAVTDGAENTASWSASPSAGVVDYAIFGRTPPTGAPFDPEVDTPLASGIEGVSHVLTGLNTTGDDETWEAQVFGRIPE